MSKTRLLDGIRNTKDLRRLRSADLDRLAAEIRAEILATTSKNGGHLSSNLGAVELCIALHYCFDTPKDRIIWDVGHQGYPHKLLTGRLKRFSSIRQHGGISGFLRRDESEYDAFGAGHAATSISAALGMVEGLCHKGDDSKVIAVIGDGGLTSGLALEGLNHAGDLEKNLIVVLNHNEMSISGNVGALSRWFSNKLTGSFYQRLRREIKGTLSSFPTMGPEMIKVVRRVLESTKVLLTPGILFEGFNFQYIGPIDGHSIPAMLQTFERIQDMDGPLLVHVVTTKGKGYDLAERDPEKFHGLGPFDPNTGKSVSKGGSPSYTQVFSDTIVEFAPRFKNMVAITAAMPLGTGLKEFAATFPKRFYDVGIAEGHAVTLASGMAAEGLKPVVAVYSTFLQRAFDQIIHDTALQNLPVLFAIDRGGLVGEDGPTHHGVFDLSYLRMIPNMVVCSPKDERELRDLFLTGIKCEGPFALRYPRGRGEGLDLTSEAEEIEIGKGEVLYEAEGADVVVAAIGSRVWPAVRAAKRLAEEGIACRVLNARFVKPLDEDLLIAACKNAKALISIEDNVISGGFGSAILDCLADKNLHLHTLRLGLPDSFIPHGSQALLYAETGIDEDGIFSSIKSFID